jgi:pseudouridine synthase
VTLPCEIKQVGKTSFDMVLTQGLNRQIRRMCEYLGYSVTRLIRKRVMHIKLDGLKPGEYRQLSAAELTQLNAQVQGSNKTA